MECINTLCKEGDIKGLDEWYLKGNLVYDNWAIIWASSKGHIDVLEWWYGKFIDSNLEFKYNACAVNNASQNGYIDVLEWWYNKSFDLQEKSMKSGLKFKYSEDAIDYASENGHIDVLEWWYSKSKDLQEKYGLEFKYNYAINWASKNGHINVLEWWYSKFINFGLEFKYDEIAVNQASKNGHIDVLEWWYNKPFELYGKSIKSGIEFKFDVKEIKYWSPNHCKKWFRKKGLLPKTQKEIIKTIVRSYNKGNYVKIIDLFN
jgi:hypothetical protein